MLYLRRHYRMLPLDAALQELYADREDRSRKRDRRTLVSLTLDDGYYDNYTHGAPLARELQVPLTIFLCPGYVESGKRFWWLESEQLVHQARVGEVTIDGCTYRLNQPDDRKALARAIDGRLRYAGSVREREDFLAAIREALAAPTGTTPQERSTRPVGWIEVHEMKASGWVSYGAHTMHHPLLASLIGPAELRREVRACRAVLEQRLGDPVRVFAYPFGGLVQIGDKGVGAVREAGYRWAVTTETGINTPRTHPYLLRRVLTDRSEHWLIVAAQAAGVWDLFRPRVWMRTRFAGYLKATAFGQLFIERHISIGDAFK
jgi:peptidoglycan/xylan/chitin deacetylase (PgdA/CDA1 family)